MKCKTCIEKKNNQQMYLYVSQSKTVIKLSNFLPKNIFFQPNFLHILGKQSDRNVEWIRNEKKESMLTEL